MPRTLTVSEIRQHLYQACQDEGGSRGPGWPSLPLLGRLFHETFATLTGPDPTQNFVRPLEQADASLDAWTRRLTDHVYLWQVGPQLLRHQAELRHVTDQVLMYWEAVRHLCRWMAELLGEQHRRQPGQSLEALRQAIFVSQEEELEAELTDPSWHDTVIVRGRVDALLRQPATGALCLVELKLGQTAPAVDLCQVCLYHLLLEQDPRGRRTAERLILVAFGPEPRETPVAPDQVAELQSRLKALIGRLADVIGPPPPPPPDTGYRELVQQVMAAFAEFGAQLRPEGEPLVGPTFIRIFAVPERGVRVSQVLRLADSVWTRLQTEQPPQLSVQRGRIAIDVPRPDRRTLFWRDLRAQLPLPTATGTTRFPVGVRVDGSLRWADLAEPENCHILVAGTTGSGKSAWLRAVLASLLASNRPETLRLVLIDPKRTAFGLCEGAPFLWRPVVYPDETDIIEVLEALVDEMEARYRHLAAHQVDDLRAYNVRADHPLPRILCLCDEYADLVLGDRRRRQEIEARVARLGAKARAAGLHLIFATQRPSREIVKGVINANLVARVALKVTRPIESRLILSDPGAATLLG